MPFRPIAQDKLDEAKGMLDAGVSYRETAEATGVSVSTLSKHFGKRRADPKPGGNRSRRATSKPGPTDEQLVSRFTKVAVAPAIPAGLILQCDYCAQHFVNTGPAAAAKLIELSHDQPALRSLLETLWRWSEEAAWATLLGMYFGIPVAHHLAPDFIYRYLMMVGLPPRGVPVTPHAHTTGDTNGNTATPPPTPFAGMDTETLLRMAEGFGVKFEPAPEPVTDAATADTAAETADTAAETADTATPGDETVTPETAASDTDTSE